MRGRSHDGSGQGAVGIDGRQRFAVWPVAVGGNGMVASRWGHGNLAGGGVVACWWGKS